MLKFLVQHLAVKTMARHYLTGLVKAFFIITFCKNIQAQARTKIICQGETDQIECSNKRNVLLISSATYGRTDVRTCSRNAIIGTTNCGSSNNALSIVQEKCNGEHQCSLFASNTVFKHPCPGTSVYLTIKFDCVRGCRKNQFECARDLKCIPSAKRCNGKKDCNDGSDEHNCEGCSNTEFECASDKQCISKSLKCNQNKDCRDGSDEEGCSCSETQFECTSNKQCIPKSLKCNQHNDCSDGSDELGCGCSESQFECTSNKQCISKSLKCNQHNDCSDGSDELGCPTVTECGSQAIKPILDAAICTKIRIVGGCVVNPPHSWPWAVQLLNLKNSQYVHECGAALLSESFALTASHCFFSDENPSRWQAIAGRHFINISENNNQIRNLAKIIRFPSDNILNKDVALIKFHTPLTLNNYVSPVCLPVREPNVADYCVVVGWGDTRKTGGENVLKQTLIPIVDRTACNATASLGGQITPYMFCGGFKQGLNDACQGDSGGPLSCRDGNTYYLQGLVSWGIDCAQPEQPGVYSNVFKFVDWIKQQMSNN